MARTKHHGDKAKQRVWGDKWRWLQSTPSWWARLMMTKPQRRKAKLWEKEVLKSPDLEDTDTPLSGKKPHIYFW